MANMSLGILTFEANPSDCTPIEADRICADQDGIDLPGFVSWGATIIGKLIEIPFTYMPASQYAAFKALEVADVAVIWNPQNGSNKTYMVEIKSCVGKYCLGRLDAGTGALRKDVKLILKIMSEIP